MPLDEKELAELRKNLSQAGLPAVFNGDRLDAFKAGMDTVLGVLAEPKPPKVELPGSK